MNTDQLVIEPVAHARRGDPETSHEAAASIPAGKIRASQAAVLGCFRSMPRAEMTDQQLVLVYPKIAAVRGWPRQSESGLRTRRSELVARGDLVDTGERVRLASGRRAIVWAAS